MKICCIVLCILLNVLTSYSQGKIDFNSKEQMGYVLSSADTLLLQIVTANVGDTILFAYAQQQPIFGIVRSNKAVNHSVTNIFVDVLTLEKTTLFISFRRGLKKGKGFIGRITQPQSSILYSLKYNDREGYHFEKKLKEKVIVN